MRAMTVQRFDWFRLAPLAFVLLWSGGFTAIRVTLEGTPPFTLLAVRYVACVLLVAPVALLRRARLPRGRALRHVVANALIVQVAYFALTTLALELGASTAATALIIALQPVLVALLAPRLAGERVDRLSWAGLGLGLAGAAIVIAARGSIAGGAAGLAAAFGALLAMTAGVLYEKRFGQAQDPVGTTLVQYLVGSAACLPLAFALEDVGITWSWRFAAGMAYLVAVNSLVSITLLLAMVRRGAAARVSAVFFLVPPAAALIAWATIGERPAPAAWLGMALAAAGVALVSRGRR